jgi:hypothetical protein
MGDAASALHLFMSDDEQEIYDLAVKLNDYNMQRQRCCDKLYESAKQKIREKGAFGNVIMLSDAEWSSGFVGIVAARIAEEYGRPTLLFVKNGNTLKGSSRSIEAINIFDALTNCSQYIEEFGGHAQAAGVNITEENFDNLERALNEYIGKTYTSEDFIPKLRVSEEIGEEFSLKLAHELNALEPYGVGHRKPLFYVTAKSLEAKPMKPRSPHIAIRNPYIEMIYFNGVKYTKLIESDVTKRLVFECNCSSFRGKESVKGFVREIVYDGTSSEIPVWRFAATVKRLQLDDGKPSVQMMGKAEIESLIEEKRAACPYGLCVIASDVRSVKEFSSLKGLRPDLIYPSAKTVANGIIVCPAADADLSDYREFVFLDTPTDFNLLGLQGKPCYVNREKTGYALLSSLDSSRNRLLKIFASLRANASNLPGGDIEETAALSVDMGFSEEECIFALSVFEELGLIAYENGSLVVYRGVHADLNDSVLYRKVTALQAKK